MTAEEAILSKIDNPHLSALINIELTNGWQCNVQDTFFKQYQLSHQQYNILRILRGQHPRGVSVNDIKRRMIDKMSNVSRLVEKLHQKGYIERTECATDRRVCFVSLSAVGIEILNAIDQTIPEMFQHFEKISADEAAVLVKLLEKMRG